MKNLIKFTVAVAFAIVLQGASTPSALAAKGDQIPLTAGDRYDRNASVVFDGSNDLWMFFARTQVPADRLAGSGTDVDNMDYDLYYMRSTNNGKTWATPVRLAANPGPAGIFRGRTIAATRRADGTIFVFWASGASGSNLYAFKKGPTETSFTAAPGLNVTATESYFNVEAVASGQTVFVYYENAYGTGVSGMTFDGSTYSAPQLVSAGIAIPKVIIDRSGTFRMTAVRASTWPIVDVLVGSSSDGIHWAPFTTAVAGNGIVTNWDPNLVQTPDGTFYLFWAPDQGDGRQRIEMKSSSDFATWSNSQLITTGTDGTKNYWDYWPEATAHGDKTSIFYTSERGLGGDPGTGHIWTMRLQ